MEKPKYKNCLKCGTKKRKNTVMLCVTCNNSKNMQINSSLSMEELTDLVEEMNIWITTLEVIQKGIIDLYDINDIIQNHDRIFDKDYIGLHLKEGAQLAIMYANIKKFVKCHDYLLDKPYKGL